MFFPIRDENPTRKAPYVTWLLIAANVAVHVWIQGGGIANQEWALAAYGLVPRRLLSEFPEQLVTVFTSMFMHGGWYHLLTNMWTLHIFGDNVEDTLGKPRFLAFYLISGDSCGRVHGSCWNPKASSRWWVHPAPSAALVWWLSDCCTSAGANLVVQR